MAKVFFSLGSNLGDKEKILFSALVDIENTIGKVLHTSSIYKSEPWGFEDENNFLNLAILVQTNMSPYDILKNTQIIENIYHRQRNGVGYQARTLDIDIIFYDDKIYFTKDLQIPHKYSHKRKFVLLPIKEIEPEFIHPLLNQTISELVENCIDKSEISIL